MTNAVLSQVIETNTELGLWYFTKSVAGYEPTSLKQHGGRSNHYTIKLLSFIHRNQKGCIVWLCLHFSKILMLWREKWSSNNQFEKYLLSQYLRSTESMATNPNYS